MKENWTYSRENAACYYALMRKRGVALSGLASAEEVEVFIKTALFFVTRGGQIASNDKVPFCDALFSFLKADASWINTDVKELLGVMQEEGFIKEVNSRIESTIQAEEELTVNSVRALWFDLSEKEREKKQAIREELTRKNREVNVRPVPAIDAKADSRFMNAALLEARKAQSAGEVPVGAVLVKDGEILARAFNAVCKKHDATAHAEMEVIREASRLLKNERLPGTTLYVTLEPCAMCAAAIAHARIDRLVWGADDPKSGAVISTLNVMEATGMNHRVRESHGLLADESKALLDGFFATKREKEE